MTSQWRIHSSSGGASDRQDNSLRLYIKKLLDSFPDDPWHGHYYATDLIAPRFFSIWIHMYLRASRYRNHTKMKEYVNDALALVPLLRPRRRLTYSAALPLMRFPFLGKAMVATHQVARRIWH